MTPSHVLSCPLVPFAWIRRQDLPASLGSAGTCGYTERGGERHSAPCSCFCGWSGSTLGLQTCSEATPRLPRWQIPHFPSLFVKPGFLTDAPHILTSLGELWELGGGGKI